MHDHGGAAQSGRRRGDLRAAQHDAWHDEAPHHFEVGSKLVVACAAQVAQPRPGCQPHCTFEKLEALLDCHYAGKAEGFVEADWSDADRHLILYLRPLGRGAVLYNTLGHCRGHWDFRPMMDYYPQVERCSWEKPEFYELLRRGLRWCLGEL